MINRVCKFLLKIHLATSNALPKALSMRAECVKWRCKCATLNSIKPFEMLNSLPPSLHSFPALPFCTPFLHSSPPLHHPLTQQRNCSESRKASTTTQPTRVSRRSMLRVHHAHSSTRPLTSLSRSLRAVRQYKKINLEMMAPWWAAQKEN